MTKTEERFVLNRRGNMAMAEAVFGGHHIEVSDWLLAGLLHPEPRGPAMAWSSTKRNWVVVATEPTRQEAIEAIAEITASAQCR